MKWRSVAVALVPRPVLDWAVNQSKRVTSDPPVGTVNLGDLRRTQPISRLFGTDRGRAVDRFYIEKFLAAHAADIRGRVLEIGDATYSRRFGGDRTERIDVLHAVAGNPQATIVDDLATARTIADATFDCIVLTQTLPFVWDFHAVVRQLHRILKPGGVVLGTVPGISQISRYDMDRWGDYWRFTSAAVRKIFGDVFGESHVSVETYGNVLSAIALLTGLAESELSRAELDAHDDDYEVIVGVRAQR